MGNIRSAGNQYEINQTNGINNVILIISKNSINSSLMSVLLKRFFFRGGRIVKDSLLSIH